jgi:hypothetical protein
MVLSGKPCTRISWYLIQVQSIEPSSLSTHNNSESGVGSEAPCLISSCSMILRRYKFRDQPTLSAHAAELGEDELERIQRFAETVHLEWPANGKVRQ